MRIRGIIFDLDGVFVEVPRDYFIEARKKALSILEEYGVSLTIESPFFRKVYDAIMSITNVPDIGLSLYKYISKVVEEFEIESLKNLRIKANARDILNELKRKGFKLAVFSQGGRRYVEEVLSKLNIVDLLDAFLTRDDTKPKPYPDGLLKICRILNVSSSEAIYVGDTLIDVETAKNAGVVPVIVIDNNESIDLKGDVIVMKRLDLENILNVLNRI